MLWNCDNVRKYKRTEVKLTVYSPHIYIYIIKKSYVHNNFITNFRLFHDLICHRIQSFTLFCCNNRNSKNSLNGVERFTETVIYMLRTIPYRCRKKFCLKVCFKRAKSVLGSSYCSLYEISVVLMVKNRCFDQNSEKPVISGCRFLVKSLCFVVNDFIFCYNMM